MEAHSHKKTKRFSKLWHTESYVKYEISRNYDIKP